MKKIIPAFFVFFLLLTGCMQKIPSDDVAQIDNTLSDPQPYIDRTYTDRNDYVKQYCLDKKIDNILYSYIDDNKKSETYGNYGYKNASSDEIMVPPKYSFIFEKCYDKTKMKGFGGFAKEERGPGIWYRKLNGEKIIQVYNFDNGPDYFKEGLSRYIDNDKVGFMNENLEIVIPAQFDWASPFDGDEARICNGCKLVSDGEHGSWMGGDWGKMNTKGEVQWIDEAELKSK